MESCVKSTTTAHYGFQFLLRPASSAPRPLLSGTLAASRSSCVKPHGQLTVTDQAVETLPARHATPISAPQAVPRWLSPAATVVRAARDGELFRRAWWVARIGRYADFVRQGALKVRDKRRFRAGSGPRSVHTAFIAATDPTAADLADMRVAAAKFRYTPTFSLICPVYNTAPKWLNAAVASVMAQSYPVWQLCLADDASTDPRTLAALAALPHDPRIAVVRQTVNSHIVAASSAAAAVATGEFLALLDHDDELAPHALFRFAELLQTHPDTDLIYSDEDKRDMAGSRYDPQFKPDWSPELLLSYNYVNHLTCIRRTVFDAAGGFRPGTDGAQDLDLLLRVTELTDRVHHVAEVLYHWRAVPESTAAVASVKPYVHVAAAAAVTAALARRAVPAEVEQAQFARALGLPVLALTPATPGPTVAVVVHGSAPAAGVTVRAVKAMTDYPLVTTYLVLDPAMTADGLNQMAAGRAEDILVFLQAGIAPAAPDWLGRLISYLALPGVGAAGGLIRAPGGSVVSAGTVTADRPRHAFTGAPTDPVSYYFLAESARSVAAPGWGCLATRRATFDRAGGFDAVRFGRTLFDADYCRRLAGLGLRTVHVGLAEFIADPDAFARRDRPTEVARWRVGHGCGPDPYTNKNLSPWADFAPAALPESVRPAPTAGPLKVLFATHNLAGCEGAPKVLADIAIGLTARGIVAAAIYAPGKLGPGAAPFVAAGLSIEAADSRHAGLFVSGQWTPRAYAAAVADFVRVIRRQAPRVVVVNTLGLFPLVEAAARCGVPAIWMVHESYTPAQFAAALTPFGRHRAERGVSLGQSRRVCVKSLRGPLQTTRRSQKLFRRSQRNT